MLEELEPGMVMDVNPLPALIPATASIPPKPKNPPEASPVVHSILSYRNITNDLIQSVASTHWNVLV